MLASLLLPFPLIGEYRDTARVLDEGSHITLSHYCPQAKQTVQGCQSLTFSSTTFATVQVKRHLGTLKKSVYSRINGHDSDIGYLVI